MPFLKNYKTTLTGLTMMAGAVADFLTQASTGAWDPTRLMADFTAFTGGLGLVFSKDADVAGVAK